MAFKTLQNTAPQADVQDADIIAIARSTGPLSHAPASAFTTYLQTSLGSTFLKVANNLSDLASVTTARTNLGLGSAATHAATDFATSAAPTITGGMTLSGGAVFTGSTAQNVNPVSALNLDWSAAEYHTKSISTNSTFTFSGITAAKGQGIVLFLTISSAAVPTWPPAVKWASGIIPAFGNGSHAIGFITPDGGTTVVGVVVSSAYA